ncbi:phage integrase N-terminal SAM-like domain-containing protein [Synechococcus elongatus]|uniref:phage integrase N-terminal SAM-like domain-containing protein n=1 Tax=Synechococcus elongatus TaxID=32046 RepID=UPI003CC82DB8
MRDLRWKNFSLNIEKSYLYYIRDFILFHNKRHPREMGSDENCGALFSEFATSEELETLVPLLRRLLLAMDAAE